MVNTERLVAEFIELVKVDSVSLQERRMADLLAKKLQALGFDVFEDDAAAKIGGTAGNLICTLKGDANIPPVLLMAHMDTVVPGTGKKPVIEGDVIRSDGTTVLGGDDAAGIACILETARILKENGITHGDIQAVFTVGEESGLLGSSNLDFSKIYAKLGFVLDDTGEIGVATISAASHNKIEVEISGRASHAGIAPEKGVSAVQIAAEAISNMKLGLIDRETTANIGIINGGKAMNIVCDKVMIVGETRSRNEDKLKAQTLHMRECFEQAAEKFGGTCSFKSINLYPAFGIGEDDAVMQILKKAAKDTGIELKPEYSNGGSDTNIISGKGIQAVDISIGMDKVHSLEEQIKISDMVRATELLVAVIKNVK